MPLQKRQLRSRRSAAIEVNRMPPLFEYNCALCGTHIESVQKFDSTAPQCCGSFTNRQVSVPGVAVIPRGGTGAQKDDYASH